MNVHRTYNISTRCSEIKGQNVFPDNHWGGGGGGQGKIMFVNKTGNFRGDSKGLFKCRPIAHQMMYNLSPNQIYSVVSDPLASH